MPFRAYNEAEIARLNDLAGLLRDFRAAFRNIVDSTGWTAAPGSAAEDDQRAVAKDDLYVPGAELFPGHSRLVSSEHASLLHTGSEAAFD
jgi:hypothetical protein